MDIKGKKILVTGGAGMIGSVLVRRLLKEGTEVSVADNLWRTNNLDNLIENDKMIIPEKDFHKVDLSEYENAVKVCRNVDIVIHLAEIVAGIGFVFNNQGFVFRKNIQINSNMFNACKENKIRYILYPGTVCSHPKEKQDSPYPPALKEDEIYPANPESAYGWSKLMGEYELELLNKENPEINICLLRFHNVYGPFCHINEKTSQVIPAIIKRVINLKDSEELEVWGTGAQTRDFVYVEDVVEAIILALKEGWNKGAIQVGSGKATSIREVAETAIKISGKNIKIKFDTTKKEGDKGRMADQSKIKATLNWTPKTSFEEGMRKTYDWIKSKISKT